MTQDAILRGFRTEDLDAVKRLIDRAIEATHGGAYPREAAMGIPHSTSQIPDPPHFGHLRKRRRRPHRRPP